MSIDLKLTITCFSLSTTSVFLMLLRRTCLRSVNDLMLLFELSYCYWISDIDIGSLTYGDFLNFNAKIICLLSIYIFLYYLEPLS